MVIYWEGLPFYGAAVLAALPAAKQGRRHKSQAVRRLRIVTGNALNSAAVSNRARSFTFQLRNRAISIITSTAEIHPLESTSLGSFHTFPRLIYNFCPSLASTGSESLHFLTLAFVFMRHVQAAAIKPGWSRAPGLQASASG